MRLSSFASTQTAKEKWDLLSAVCLERKPVIARNLLPIEKEVLSMAQQIEYRLSLKSDHEIQLEKDRQVCLSLIFNCFSLSFLSSLENVYF